MRRTLVTALAVPVLLLSACGSDEPEVEDVTTSESEEAPTTEDPGEEDTTEAGPATEEPTDDSETTEDPTDDTEATEDPTDDTEATEAPGDDDGEATEAPGDGEAEGGAEGQAAADRTKEWLVAFVNADEAVCDMMLDLESEGPMVDNQAHYDVCVSTFPTQAGDMFGDSPEITGIIESMDIKGADVQGDTAVVDKDNFSPLFAEGMGNQVITLQKVDGEWLVDMNESFN